MELIILKTARATDLDDRERGRIDLTTIDDVPMQLEVDRETAAQLIAAALNVTSAIGAARAAQPPGSTPRPQGVLPLHTGRVDIRPVPEPRHVGLAFRLGVLDLLFHLPIAEVRRIGEGLVRASTNADLEPPTRQ